MSHFPFINLHSYQSKCNLQQHSESNEKLSLMLFHVKPGLMDTDITLTDGLHRVEKTNKKKRL